MQIGAQGIENMLITFIIEDYGVEKKATLKKQASKKTPFHSIYSNFEIEIYLRWMRHLVSPKHVYPMQAPMLPLMLGLIV
jgi:hypothetical protein